ncbi:MAG: GvpL/GvpF family gas vesicle protein [Dehalococcoidia bacterium]|nr:GvpL/GvpF family gas vesicle protein [Dehalococcoidia bacterium]
MTSLPGQYLYGVVRCSAERTFGDVAPIGDPQGPVHTVPCNGLAVVVSNTPVGEYEITRANMMAHQRVLERVMLEYTVLPVRFGTVAQDPCPSKLVRKLLAARSGEFGRLLAEMDGMAELGLKALWRDEKAIFQEIVGQNGAIRQLRDSLEGKPSQATHFQRIRLGELVKGAMDQKRATEAQGILAPLRQIAVRAVENQLIADRIVANAAFLVDRRREEEFDQAVAKLDRGLGHRMVFKYVGPVPPYNFVNLTVNWSEL